MAENEGPNEEQDQQEEDLAGYGSTKELANAYRASGTEAKRWMANAQQSQQALNQALQQLQMLTQANPRQDIPQRNDYASRLAEAGVPAEPVYEIAREIARQEMQQMFEPMVKGAQARNQLLGKYGQDYTKFESDVYAYLQSDPEVNRSYENMFKVDPAGAMDYAFLKFGDAQRREHGNGRAKPERSSAEAQIPSNRSGESRRAPANGNDVTRAFERFREDPNTANARMYAKARLHGVISDDFLNQ